MANYYNYNIQQRQGQYKLSGTQKVVDTSPFNISSLLAHGQSTKKAPLFGNYVPQNIPSQMIVGRGTAISGEQRALNTAKKHEKQVLRFNSTVAPTPYFHSAMADLLKALPERERGNADGQLGYEYEGGISLNWKRVRDGYRGTPVYFHPGWAILFSLNRLAAANKYASKIERKGWSLDQIFEKKAITRIKGTIKRMAHLADPDNMREWLAKAESSKANYETRVNTRVADMTKLLNGGARLRAMAPAIRATGQLQAQIAQENQEFLAARNQQGNMEQEREYERIYN